MQELIRQLEDTGEYRVIKRFEPVTCYHVKSEQCTDIKQAIFLDVETTGMNPATDKIIELAMVPFEFDSSGKIYDVLRAYNAFQDPDMPIPQKITDITGITNDMVAGHAIDLKVMFFNPYR